MKLVFDEDLVSGLERKAGVEVEEKKTVQDPRDEKKKVPQVEREKLLVQAEAAGRQEHVKVEPLAKAVAGKQKQVGEGQQTEGAAVYRGQMKRKVVEQRKREQLQFFEEPVLESH